MLLVERRRSFTSYTSYFISTSRTGGTVTREKYLFWLEVMVHYFKVRSNRFETFEEKIEATRRREENQKEARKSGSCYSSIYRWTIVDFKLIKISIGFSFFLLARSKLFERTFIKDTVESLVLWSRTIPPGYKQVFHEKSQLLKGLLIMRIRTDHSVDGSSSQHPFLSTSFRSRKQGSNVS